VIEACSRNDAVQLTQLLRRGVSPNATNADGESFLYLSLTWPSSNSDGGLACVKALLEAKADPSKPSGGLTGTLTTPLKTATLLGRAGVARALLDAGAVHDEMVGGEEPLWLATKLLAMCYGDREAADEDGGDGMGKGGGVDHAGCMEVLLERADTKLKLKSMNTVASMNTTGAVRVLQRLLDSGVDPDQVSTPHVLRNHADDGHDGGGYGWWCWC